MDITELTAKLAACDLKLVEVEDWDSKSDTVTVRGDIRVFCSTAKTLGCSVVFAESRLLESEDFKLSFEVSSYPPVYADVDLTEYDASIAKYKKYIDQVGAYCLYAPFNQGYLFIAIEEPWYSSFWELASVAGSAAIEKEKHQRESQEKKSQERRAELLKQLRDLVQDSKFMSLPTQKQMQAYATDKLPELNELPTPDIKRALQEIDATAKAKGLR